MDKSSRQCASKASPRLFLILVNTLKEPLHARSSLKIRFFERGLSKSMKKLTFIYFFSNPVPFNGQDYEKRKGPGTSDQSLIRLQNKFKNIPLLVMYYLTMFGDII